MVRPHLSLTYDVCSPNESARPALLYGIGKLRPFALVKVEIDQSILSGYRTARFTNPRSGITCALRVLERAIRNTPTATNRILDWNEDSEAIMEEIANVVHGYILNEFLPGEDPQELTENTPLITGGILDSITTLKLVVFLEEHFGITVEAHEAGVERLDSIGQIVQLVAEKKRAA
jgi:acyl carrier protein